MAKKDNEQTVTQTAGALPLKKVVELTELHALPHTFEDEKTGETYTEPGKVVAWVGPPGNGKTASAIAFAKKHGYKVIIIPLTTMVPESMNGIPTVDVWDCRDPETGKVTAMKVANDLMPKWQAYSLTPGNEKTLYLVDEFTNVETAVQGSVTQTLQDRKFPGGVSLPVESILLVAMNSPEDSVGGYTIPAPLQNRIAWYAWEPDVHYWLEGMATKWDNPMSKNERLWREAIVDFVSTNTGFFYDHDHSKKAGVGATADQAEVNRNAWYSPRTWDNLAWSLARVDMTDETTVAAMASATVGFEASVEFCAFISKRIKLVPATTVLDNPEAAEPVLHDEGQNSNEDSRMVLVRNLVQHVINNPGDPEGKTPAQKNRNLTAFLTIMNYIADDHKGLWGKLAPYLASNLSSLAAAFSKAGMVSEVTEPMLKLSTVKAQPVT